MCIPICTTVVHDKAQSTSDNIPPLYLQTTTIAQKLSIREEGEVLPNGPRVVGNASTGVVLQQVERVFARCLTLSLYANCAPRAKSVIYDCLALSNVHFTRRNKTVEFRRVNNEFDCRQKIWNLHVLNKNLSYRRGTARYVVSIEILPIATQQCRNYLYDKSWPNRWYEVGDLVGGNAW